MPPPGHVSPVRFQTLTTLFVCAPPSSSSRMPIGGVVSRKGCVLLIYIAANSFSNLFPEIIRAAFLGSVGGTSRHNDDEPRRFYGSRYAETTIVFHWRTFRYSVVFERRHDTLKHGAVRVQELLPFLWIFPLDT